MKMGITSTDDFRRDPRPFRGKQNINKIVKHLKFILVTFNDTGI